MPDVERNRIQLALMNGSTHEIGQDYTQYFSTTFPKFEQVLEAGRKSEIKPREFTIMDMGPLAREAKTSVEARVELHNRLVLPPACLLLALIGAPLGLSSRKGGKSSAFVLTVIVAFLYYMGLVTLIGLARQQTLPVEIAMWLPNVILLVVGSFMVARMERPGDRDIIGGIRERVAIGLLVVPRKSAIRFTGSLVPNAAARSADHRQLRSVGIPLLFRSAAGQLRTDDARLHVLRASQRHSEERHPDGIGRQVSFLSDAEAGLRFHSGQRAGRGTGYLRHSHKEQ